MKKQILLLFITLISFTELFSQRLPDLIPYRKGNLWGYCDSNKKIIIEPKYKGTMLFSDGLGRVLINDSISGFIDPSGKLIFSYHWLDTTIEDFYFDRAKVSVIIRSSVHTTRGGAIDWRSKVGFIDKNRKLVISFVFKEDDTGMGFWNLHSVVSTGNKMAVIDTNGNYVLKPSRKIFNLFTMNKRFVHLYMRHGPHDAIYDIEKRKVIIKYDQPYNMDMSNVKNEMRELGYSNQVVDELFPVGPPKQTLWYNARCFGGQPSGYMDKYGTKYWDD